MPSINSKVTERQSECTSDLLRQHNFISWIPNVSIIAWGIFMSLLICFCGCWKINNILLVPRLLGDSQTVIVKICKRKITDITGKQRHIYQINFACHLVFQIYLGNMGLRICLYMPFDCGHSPDERTMKYWKSILHL